MTKRRKMVVGSLVAIVLLGLVSVTSYGKENKFMLQPSDDIRFDISYDGPPIKLRLSHHAPETHPIMANVFIPWTEQVRQVSKGKLIIERFMGATLHGARDGFKAIANDITDITAGYTVWQPQSFDLEHAMMLPFAFNDEFVAVAVGYELYPKYFKGEYEKMGVVLGSYLTTTANDLISRRPVTKVSDLKGMKVIADGQKAEMMKLLGAVPINMPTPELYSAFQRGVADAIMQTTADMINWKTYEIGKHHLEFNLGHVTLPHALNVKTFQSLPPDLRKVLYTMLQLLAWENAAHYQWSTVEAFAMLRTSGIALNAIDDKEKANWREKLEPMWNDFIQKNVEKGLKAKECIEAMREANKKYSSWTPAQIRQQMIKAPFPNIIDGM